MYFLYRFIFTLLKQQYYHFFIPISIKITSNRKITVLEYAIMFFSVLCTTLVFFYYFDMPKEHDHYHPKGLLFYAYFCTKSNPIEFCLI